MYTLNVYVSVCMCSECGCPQRPGEGIKVPGAGVTRDCEPPIHVGAWNRTQVLIREQQMALSIKSSRQLLSFTLWKHLLLLLYQHPWRENPKRDQLACILLTRPTEAWERPCSDSHEGGKYRLRGGWTSFASVSLLSEPLYYTWSPAGNKTSQESHWKWEPFLCVCGRFE